MHNFREELVKVTELKVNLVLEGEPGVGKEHFARFIHQRRHLRGAFLLCDCEIDKATQKERLQSILSRYEKDLKQNNLKENSYFFKNIHFLSKESVGYLVSFFASLEEQFKLYDYSHTKCSLMCSLEDGNTGQEKLLQSFLYEYFLFTVTIPPLRQRISEIPVIANKFLSDFEKKYHKRLKGFSFETLRLLRENQWRNNICELSSAVERAVILAKNSSYISPREFLGKLSRESS